VDKVDMDEKQKPEWLALEIQQIRNESFPRLYSVIDGMKQDLKEGLATIITLQSKIAVIEAKVEIISKFLWGTMSLVAAGFVGIITWFIQMGGAK